MGHPAAVLSQSGVRWAVLLGALGSLADGGQMTPGSVADITPNGVATPLGTAGQKATAIMLTAVGNTCRWGDANVGATRGQKLPTGVPVTIHRASFAQGEWPLDKVYVYATGADYVTVSFGA